MDIHKLSDGSEIASVHVVLSGEPLDRLKRAAEALGRTPDDLATAAVEEAVLGWSREAENTAAAFRRVREKNWTREETKHG